MNRLRYFAIGTLIVVMAFPIHSWAMTVVQVIAGIVYFSLGFVKR